MVRINDDLPAPLGPNNPNMPFDIDKFTLFNACTPLSYVLERLAILSMYSPSQCDKIGLFEYTFIL